MTKELPEPNEENIIIKFTKGFLISLKKAGNGFEIANKDPDKMAISVIPFNERNKLQAIEDANKRRSKKNERGFYRNLPQKKN